MVRNTFTLAIAATMSFVSLLAACGGDDDTTGAGNAATTTASGGSGGSGAVGGSGAIGGGGSGATGGSGGTGGAVPNEANIFLSFGNDVEFNNRWAAFGSQDHSDPDRIGHVVWVNDDCYLADYRVEGHAEGDPVGPSPGLVTLSGGSLTGTTLDPSNDGADYNTISPGMWEPGDVITASAPGDELPSFEIARTMPVALELIAPDLENAANDELHLDVAAPYPISWTPAEGTVLVQLDQGPDPEGPDAIHLVCLFAGTSGSGTLPVDGLAEFEADTAEISTRLGAGLFDYEQATLGDRPFLVIGGSWRDRTVITD